MRLRSCTWRWLFTLAIAGAVSSTAAFAPLPPAQNKKPSISLKATPPVGFPPLRVVVTAEVKGGANDFEDFYCASVEWDWGDGTKSESKEDCDPYEAGKSEIKRRYAAEHVFRSNTMDMSGSSPPLRGGSSSIDGMGSAPTFQHRVRFILRQKGRTVGSGQTTVEVRQGVGY